MVRELLAEARIRTEQDTPASAHGAALNAAAGIVMERWATGYPSPGPTARLENVHLRNKETGELLGFRIYLVSMEPTRLGGPSVEYLE